MFSNIYNQLDWHNEKKSIYAKTEHQVRQALNRAQPDLEDFKALVSPAAEEFLEQMVQRSVQLTRQRFGYTLQIFTPFYLSNLCKNCCTYCGFSASNKIPRKVLSMEEILAEGHALKDKGFQQILLVTGEAPSRAGVDYLGRAIDLLSPLFSQISIEVQPLEAADYKVLMDKSLFGVSLYQETYRRPGYEMHHVSGSKADMRQRLNTPDKMGGVQIQKIGLGVLLGLEDWRVDSLFCAHHLKYIQSRFWRTSCSISFPRLRPAPGGYQVRFPVSDPHLLQLITAWRIFDPDLDLVLSTRESSALRDQLCQIGITSMSAEASTRPGGHTTSDNQLEQFEVSDKRSLPEITRMLQAGGYSVVNKNWGWG